ncbi:MAG TPA: metal-dependent transcriptional regulator [Crocinitomix sp.]|nr:metal-dependent transcriptional regulator [Crocinitomix sp.]
MKYNLSQSEENYLKSIYNLIDKTKSSLINTNLIADDLKTKASSVSEMIKKLSEKELIEYKKYKGSQLTENGNAIAVQVIRKHRLWETFLVEKLNFEWDEVHEIAEQLEHIKSIKLTNKLSEFLGHPKFDPHGDPIPNEKGIFPKQHFVINLKQVKQGQFAEVVNIGSDNKNLLIFLTKNNIGIGTKIKCVDIYDFDDSIKIELMDKRTLILSKKVIKNINVKLN